MLSSPFVKIIRVTCVIRVVGTAQYINPKNSFFSLRQAQGERNSESMMSLSNHKLRINLSSVNRQAEDPMFEELLFLILKNILIDLRGFVNRDGKNGGSCLGTRDSLA